MNSVRDTGFWDFGNRELAAKLPVTRECGHSTYYSFTHNHNAEYIVCENIL